MVDFSFVSNKKILFGCGKTVELIPLLTALEGKVLFLTGQSIKGTNHFDKLTKLLNENKIPMDFKTVSGEPSPETVDALTNFYRNKDIMGVVALGGGSVLDAGKAVSAMLCEEGSVQDYLEGVGTKQPSGRKVPFFAVPTTAGTGSECTKNAVISRPGPEGYKKSLRHDNFIPDVAIIDPDWTESLPAQIGASCGMDAFSQLLESYLSTQASPLTDCLAEEGLKRFFNSFSAIMEGQGNSSNREDISLGAALSGLSLANAGYGTVHGIAGVLGGLHSIPHGCACGILMPSVMRQTLSILLEKNPSHPSLIKAVKLGRELKGNFNLSIENSIFSLISQLDFWEDQAALPSLREYGIKKEDLKKVVLLSGNSNNPYPFSEAERLNILENCY